MIFTGFAKILGSLIGLYTWKRFPDSAYGVAAAIGILPIWLEVIATYATGIEPSLETRQGWKILDNLIDGHSFILFPVAWFYCRFSLNPFFILALAAFMSCGIFRLIRFVRSGLLEGEYFEGLPVTYTGYAWIVLAWLHQYGLDVLGMALLGLLSFAMVWKRVKIRRTQV